MGGILGQTQMRRADGTPSKITAADAFAGLPGFLGAVGRNAGGVFANVASMASKPTTSSVKQNLSGGKDPGSVGRKSTILTGAQGLPRVGGIQPLEDDKKKRLGE